jgi:hypothetical protein
MTMPSAEPEVTLSNVLATIKSATASLEERDQGGGDTYINPGHKRA